MKTFIISLKIFLFFTILTGVVYPLLITGIVQVVFPAKANGSLIVRDRRIVGSELIGQHFDSAIYFTSRPSVILYNALPSGGSNYGLTNMKLKGLVTKRKHDFYSFNQLDSLTTIPSEMVFASASGLDPHISPQAALLQVDRIAKARYFNDECRQKMINLIKDLTEGPQFLCLGKERVNVLLLNLETDRIQ
ncbi:MAG: potassium-transporting ATPase subunit KdpC [Bacteroidetes bacterium]|nr:potassium-transporting ATPase subunit KdpC [Bacteroidota bacterium]